LAPRIVNLLSKDRYFAVLIVTLSFCIGITGIVLNGMQFSPDSTGFHNYAVNLVAGRGYTSDLSSEPQTKLNREPGYPVFLGVVYRVYANLGEISYIQQGDYDLEEKRLLSNYPEIWAVKYFQALLMALGVLLFYKSLLPFFAPRTCKLSALILSIFYPYQVFSSFLLRESLIAFFTVLLGYLLCRYYSTRKGIFMLGAAAVLALGSLTWQAYMAFTPLVPIMLWFASKDFAKLIKYSALSGIVYIVLIFPWLWFSYSKAADIKIVKSMGTTYTHELMNYVAAMDKAVFHKLITANEKRKLEDEWYYDLSSKEVVENSFTGIYTRKADSLNAELKRRGKSELKYLMVSSSQRLANMFFQTHWYPHSLPKGIGSLLRSYRNEGFIYTLFGLGMVSISLFIALFSLTGLGLMPAGKQLALLPFWGFLVFFYPIGSVSRRFMPVIPWMILLSVFAVTRMFQRCLQPKLTQNNQKEVQS